MGVFSKLYRLKKRVTNVKDEAKDEVMTSNQAFAPESAVHNVGQSSSSRPTAKAEVLQAISVGDLPRLQSLFSSLGIQSGQPAIEYPYDHEFSAEEPPSTNEMLVQAATSLQPSILTFLLHIFATARLTDRIIGQVVDAKSIPLFRALLAHNRSVLDHEFENTSTPLSMACWGSDPDFALFLLAEGADPNGPGFLALSTLGIAIQKQPVTLVRRLVERGATVRGSEVFSQAVETGRVDVVRVLLESGVDEIQIREALSVSERRQDEEMIHLLEQSLDG